MFLGLRLFLWFLSAEKIPLLLDAGWILAVSICLCVHPVSSLPSSRWICLTQGSCLYSSITLLFPFYFALLLLGSTSPTPVWRQWTQLSSCFQLQTQQVGLGCSHFPKGTKIPCSSCDPESFLPSSPSSTHPVPPVPGGWGKSLLGCNVF